MKTRIIYFGIYLTLSAILFGLASFIDFAFGLRMFNFGIQETIKGGIILGTGIGIIFGLILKLHPIKFPWEHMH